MPAQTFRLTVHGLTYGVHVAGDGPPLLLLHGFTGSALAWARHVPALAAHFRTICVDLPGHGDTDAPAEPARYGMDAVVADLLAVVDRLTPHPGYPLGGLSQPRERGVRSDTNAVALTPGPSPASPASEYPERGPGGEGFLVLGYSMGARVALHLALAAPDRVRALVLESASPGIADPEERAARRAGDAALAERIEREGVAAFVRYWEALPLFAAQSRLPEEERARQRAQRLAATPLGLANSLRGAGAGAQGSLWDCLGRLTMPVLLVTGALDGKYMGIAAEMAARLPRARRAVVPDAGHTPHFEQPGAFSTTVVPWLLEHATGCCT